MIAFEDPSLHLALAVAGTMFIVVAIVVNVTLLAKAVVFAAGAIGTALALLNRKD